MNRFQDDVVKVKCAEGDEARQQKQWSHFLPIPPVRLAEKISLVAKADKKQPVDRAQHFDPAFIAPNVFDGHRGEHQHDERNTF